MSRESFQEQLEQTNVWEPTLLQQAAIEIFPDVIRVGIGQQIQTWRQQKAELAKRGLNSQVNEEIPNPRNRAQYFLTEEYKQRLGEAQSQIDEMFIQNAERVLVLARQTCTTSLTSKMQELSEAWSIHLDDLATAAIVLNIFSQSYVDAQGNNEFPNGKLNAQVARNRLIQAGFITPQESRRDGSENNLTDEAKRLGISVEEYRDLLQSGLQAKQIYLEEGPFWGKEDAPTWRIATEALTLPLNFQEQLKEFGDDLWRLADALLLLPYEYKQLLGEEMVYSTRPVTIRPDIIITPDGKIRCNELELCDGARGLKTAHALAYLRERRAKNRYEGLSPDVIAQSLQALSGKQNVQAVWIRSASNADPDARAFSRMVEEASGGNVTLLSCIWNPTLGNENFERIKGQTPTTDVVLYGNALSQEELTTAFGLPPERVVPQMSYGAIGSKALFPLLFEPNLKSFWIQQLGSERFSRLQSILIPSHFIKTVTDAEQALRSGKVVKVCAVPQNARNSYDKYTGNGTGTWYLPVMDNWEQLKARRTIEDLIQAGCLLLVQDYTPSKQFQVRVIRNGGRSLGTQKGSTRICVTYCAINPNDPENRKVVLADAEATIGDEDNFKPAGRDCCYTGVRFGA